MQFSEDVAGLRSTSSIFAGCFRSKLGLEFRESNAGRFRLLVTFGEVLLQLNDVLLLGLNCLLLQLDLVVLTLDGLVERGDGCVLGVLAKSVLLELLNSSHSCFVCL